MERCTSLLKRLSFVLSFAVLITALSGDVFASKNKPLRKHENSEMKIALTFDDGPHESYTSEILDILDEYKIKATFFVIGRNCTENPDIVCREIESGHEVGNHTYSHPHLTKIREEKLRSEIIATENILFELKEYQPRLFRPPEGVYSGTVSKTLEGFDYTPILWTVDTTDWRTPSAEKIVDRVLDNISSGAIILCHDYVSGKSNTPEALRIFIPELINRGYKFVTVSELLMSE
ncbi:MAG: polysaccharide deacetylase family protein [Clostridia bacterium]|nr:polysaccharide deacetylase family protein [Clostridia bacterium]